jgi:hypothetical protein
MPDERHGTVAGQLANGGRQDARHHLGRQLIASKAGWELGRVVPRQAERVARALFEQDRPGVDLPGMDRAGDAVQQDNRLAGRARVDGQGRQSVPFDIEFVQVRHGSLRCGERQTVAPAFWV